MKTKINSTESRDIEIIANDEYRSGLKNETDNYTWLKDIGELSVSTKFVFLTFVPSLILWFIVEYLYFPVILTIKWYYAMAFCIVPTVICHELNIVFILMLLKMSKIDFTETTRDCWFWFTSRLDLVLFLLLMILFPILLNASFYLFLAVIFGYKFIIFAFLGPIGRSISKIIG